MATKTLKEQYLAGEIGYGEYVAKGTFIMPSIYPLSLTNKPKVERTTPDQCRYQHKEYDPDVPHLVVSKAGDLTVFCGACGKEYSYYGK